MSERSELPWREELRASRRRWLVTGAAGFIGSHLVEALLAHGQRVRGLDNFATGSKSNLFPDCEFIEGDIRDFSTCRRACSGIELVLHQAALGSVPRSIAHPQETNAANVDGFVNMAIAARDEKAQRFVYASSSSVYGDEPTLPKSEGRLGVPLSPYAVTKRTNELYAEAFQRAYGLPFVGLRYFNVFGARQDANGPYAAVIPLWFSALLRGQSCVINGDGQTSRDFCYVKNAVQANIRAALGGATGVFNIACGERTTLNRLFELIRERAAQAKPGAKESHAQHADFRAGDIRHSLADISAAKSALGYQPEFSLAQGLDEAAAWYTANA